jgi:hypothetical protein
VFHVQFRQFPNVARAFNLSRDELYARILVPWAAGESVKWGDRRWSPDRARLTIYEGPALRPEEIGLGRGWANATRSGEDVTARLLAESERPSPREEALEQLKDEVLARAGAGRMDVRDVVSVAGGLHPQWRASDRLALAEQAVWELLHRGSLRLARADEAGGGLGVVGKDEWEPLLLDWATWGGERRSVLNLERSDE